MPNENSSGAVRTRYERLASAPGFPFGEHVHHGYSCEGGDLLGAQRRLIEKLAGFAELPQGARVLDIGCGTGGAARWLVRKLGQRTRDDPAAGDDALRLHPPGDRIRVCRRRSIGPLPRRNRLTLDSGPGCSLTL